MMWPFVAWPWLTAVPAFVFGYAARETGRRALWITAGLWVAYSIYEGLMQRRLLCTGECNIRVDLLLIAPILIWRSAAGIWQLLRNKP